MPPEVLLSSEGRGWRGFEAELLRIPPGRTDVPGGSLHRLSVHFGRAVNADCRCDSYRSRRVQKHGDIDVVPAGLDGSWQDDAACTILRLRVSTELVREAAIDRARVPDQIVPRFQLRDPRIEAVAWAIKADLEAEAPSDRLYAEALGLALASRLVDPGMQHGHATRQTLTVRQRRLLVEYIDANLDQSLSLPDLATVAGLSVSHLKTVFGNTFGVPVHRYVVRCRVERARLLLLSGGLPMSQVALEAGFADQSHMANCMRRVLGLTPGTVARQRM